MMTWDGASGESTGWVGSEKYGGGGGEKYGGGEVG